MVDKQIGERIKYLRESNGYTREDLAERAEISSKFLYEIEMGKKGFSAEILLHISKVLSVSCDYIMTGCKIDGGNTEKVSSILESFDPKQMGRVKDILRLMLKISRESEKSQTE